MHNLRWQAGRPGVVDPENGRWYPVMGGGKGNVNIPPPTPLPAPSAAQTEATQLSSDVMRQQLEIAKQQQAFSNAVSPIMLATSGYNMMPDTGQPLEEGQYRIPMGGQNYVVGVKPEVKSLMDMNAEVSRLGLERQKAALSGSLPVDPSVEADLQRGEEELREQLLRRIGPGYETDDRGVRALSEFTRQANSLRHQVRTGELSSAGAISTNADARLRQKQEQAIGSFSNVQSPYLVSAQLLGNAGGTASDIVNRGQQERFHLSDMQLRHARMNMEAGQAQAGMIGSGVGGLVSSGIIGGAMIL